MFDIKPHWLDILSRLKLNLSHLYLLNKVAEQQEVNQYKDSKALQKLMFLDECYQFTTLGRDFYDGLLATPVPEPSTKTRKIMTMLTKYDADWKKFWSEWPRTANFEYKGQKFFGNRNLIGDTEQKCKNAWIKGVMLGNDPNDILKAAQVEITLTKDESFRRKENKLAFLPMMITWLNQERWKQWKGVEIPTNINPSQMETEI